ncbi:hypothetical protein [Metabacillus fastidiosus]|uniref:hypothetical protein n=1 Tax=Metabacillus fastidiosus TaxID=1458 RepID=UPI003D28D40E
MADKIFIADKATQNLIKDKTDLIGTSNPTTGNRASLMNYIKLLENLLGVLGAANPTVANTANLMNYIKQLENKVASLDTKVNSVQSQVTEGNLNVGTLYASGFSGSGNKTLISITGTGRLKFLIFQPNIDFSHTFNLQIDNKVTNIYVPRAAPSPILYPLDTVFNSSMLITVNVVNQNDSATVDIAYTLK